MGFSEAEILSWFATYAYQPNLVYFAIVALMIASSFGLPVPEEVTLVGTGIVCYIGSRPDLYPPPYPGAPVVQVEVAATVALAAVFLSDYVVFSLGRFFGHRLVKTSFFKRNQDTFDKVKSWVDRYGMWAAGIFRFTPGLRFPGHLSCGMLGLRPSRFFLVDGAAALISVPTQVVLVAKFGEHILGTLQQFKIVLFSVIGLFLVFFIVKKLIQKRKDAALRNTGTGHSVEP
ncbi:DedA family protein [Pseudobacteriovorax antillogorgiicola]|uniref:Membrane protein DedA, SNARE-associated domain n=1 Tax=Pseudobacteriovorax antillogorgiicola TaxID=1513793 RepID=A0A1Y6C149_9BACT|nr:DedA family protein [Pseudobacteriovorax antillogorgiicola]TCS52267.1 membrane protein DedA with SNARE-associated domain [Pseudobacteriovorax antillogorgiicola]SMF30923.1 membrane protein DedA, SNARE-associated domain [Pseudobacteriovorax antillogorgiicola]